MKKASEARSGTKNGRHNKLKQREGQKDEKKEKVLLFSFVLAAFLLRIYMTTLEYSVVWDGYYYGVLGKNLISGRFDEGLSTYWPPLYPLLVGISSLFFSDPKFAASFVSVVAGSLLIIPVYFLIKEFYGKKAAPMGAFLVIVYPSLVVYSSVFLTEATYTLLFTTGILTGWFAITREKGLWFILTGLLFAACYLVKPEAFAFIGLVLVLVLSATLLRRKLRLTRTYSHLSLLLIGFVVLSFPYLLYLHEKIGRAHV